MISRTLFSSTHDIYRESVRRFIEEEVITQHPAWEKHGVVSREVWQLAGDKGLLCPSVSQEFSGPGADFLYGTIVTEELARAGGGVYRMLAGIPARAPRIWS